MAAKRLKSVKQKFTSKDFVKKWGVNQRARIQLFDCSAVILINFLWYYANWPVVSDVICIKRENIILLNLFLFKEEACICYADNVDPEQKLRSVVSDLALHALPMSLLWDAMVDMSVHDFMGHTTLK